MRSWSGITRTCTGPKWGVPLSETNHPLNAQDNQWVTPQPTNLTVYEPIPVMLPRRWRSCCSPHGKYAPSTVLQWCQIFTHHFVCIMAPLGEARRVPRSPPSKKEKYVSGLIFYNRTGDRKHMGDGSHFGGLISERHCKWRLSDECSLRRAVACSGGSAPGRSIKIFLPLPMPMICRIPISTFWSSTFEDLWNTRAPINGDLMILQYLERPMP
jgi:hypothetical protein